MLSLKYFKMDSLKRTGQPGSQASKYYLPHSLLKKMLR